jgi:hypothetical protein
VACAARSGCGEGVGRGRTLIECARVCGVCHVKETVPAEPAMAGIVLQLLLSVAMQASYQTTQAWPTLIAISAPIAQPFCVLRVASCRDLKPANLMIGGSYIESDIQRRIVLHELGTMKIADFGTPPTMHAAG